MISIDFEKAFDSVEWKFMIEVLKKFNFGPNFIHWIKAFYKNIESCTINNGVTSGYFELSRGVRQGDPISPYLFILCAEVLASKVRNNNEIEGLTIENEELKIMQFADDTNGIVANLKSAKTFISVVQEFGLFSGLYMNKDKCEAIWLGKDRNNKSKPLGIAWPEKPMKVLGIYISYDDKENEFKNTQEKLLKIKSIINSWKKRNLTMLGRIQILKSYILSSFQYLISMVHICTNLYNGSTSVENMFVTKVM